MSNRICFWLAFIINLVSAFFYVEFISMNKEFVFSMADAFIVSLSLTYYTKMVLMWVIYKLYVNRSEMHSMFILRKGGKKEIWLDFVKKDCIEGVFFAIIMIGCAVASIIVHGYGGRLINWNDTNSFFSSMAMGRLSNTSFVLVSIKGVLLLASIMIICLQFSHLLIWITDNRALPLMVIAAISISDVNQSEIFFTRFRYSLSQWADTSMGGIDVVAKLVVLMMGIILIGFLYSDKKEFIGKKDA